MDAREIVDKIREKQFFGESNEHDMGYLLDEQEAEAIITEAIASAVEEARAAWSRGEAYAGKYTPAATAYIKQLEASLSAQAMEIERIATDAAVLWLNSVAVPDVDPGVIAPLRARQARDLERVIHQALAPASTEKEDY